MDKPKKRIVFYSWLSDLPDSSNRDFIEESLRDACNAICEDESIKEELSIDRSTLGVGGSLDIPSTILNKIDNSDIVVCDISIVGELPKRYSPNPNVLTELGYAFSAKGFGRVIMVFNCAYGDPGQLPFDFRNNKAILYKKEENEQEITGQNCPLSQQLEDSLRLILETIHAQESAAPKADNLLDDAIEAIENDHPSKKAKTRKFLNGLLTEIVSHKPVYEQNTPRDETFIQAIGNTIELSTGFAKICESVSLRNDTECANELHKYFEKIIQHYDIPKGYIEVWDSCAFDYYRFVGQQLFCILISFLLREEEWVLIDDLLSKDLCVSLLFHEGKEAIVPYSYISKRVELFNERNKRLKLNRVSVYSDTVHERHKKGPLAELVPFEQYMDADLLLYIRSALPPDDDRFDMYFPWANKWMPWSILYSEGRIPPFLTKAINKTYASNLLKALNVDDAQQFINGFPTILSDLWPFFGSLLELRGLSSYDPSTFGSR